MVLRIREKCWFIERSLGFPAVSLGIWIRQVTRPLQGPDKMPYHDPSPWEIHRDHCCSRTLARPPQGQDRGFDHRGYPGCHPRRGLPCRYLAAPGCRRAGVGSSHYGALEVALDRPWRPRMAPRNADLGDRLRGVVVCSTGDVGSTWSSATAHVIGGEGVHASDGWGGGTSPRQASSWANWSPTARGANARSVQPMDTISSAEAGPPGSAVRIAKAPNGKKRGMRRTPTFASRAALRPGGAAGNSAGRMANDEGVV